MAKQDKSTDTALATRTPAFRARREQPPIFADAREEREWYRAQEQRERELADAAAKYPPGTVLEVTTARGISRRGRAGLTFTDKGRTTVEVTDLDDDQLARVRNMSQADIEKLHAGGELEGLEGVDGKTAAKVASGNFVTSMGAKSIVEDDGLQVRSDKATDTAATPADAAALQTELDAVRAENKSLREAVARLKGESRKGQGGPERLASSSADFGGSGEDKSKA